VRQVANLLGIFPSRVQRSFFGLPKKLQQKPEKLEQISPPALSFLKATDQWSEAPVGPAFFFKRNISMPI